MFWQLHSFLEMFDLIGLQIMLFKNPPMLLYKNLKTKYILKRRVRQFLFKLIKRRTLKFPHTQLFQVKILLMYCYCSILFQKELESVWWALYQIWSDILLELLIQIKFYTNNFKICTKLDVDWTTPTKLRTEFSLIFIRLPRSIYHIFGV